MNVLITMRYLSPAGPVLQQGEFYLKGRTPEIIAYEWWNQIKKDVYTEGLVEVKVNGDDITEKVKALLNE
jgi:hypothetical protein